MSPTVERRENATVERLLAEFNEILRLQGRADFALLEQCLPSQRKELLSLMNVAALAYRALAPERQAFRARNVKIAN
jgi:hypothetical protein